VYGWLRYGRPIWPGIRLRYSERCSTSDFSLLPCRSWHSSDEIACLLARRAHHRATRSVADARFRRSALATGRRRAASLWADRPSRTRWNARGSPNACCAEGGMANLQPDVVWMRCVRQGTRAAHEGTSCGPGHRLDRPTRISGSGRVAIKE